MGDYMTIRDAILNVIESNQGLKGVELALKVMSLVTPNHFNHDNFQTELQKLVNERRIVELTYELSNMDYRTKSMYFPKGTKLHYIL
jgi:hypothetical protein